jgi:hypothetical protein
MQSAGAPAQGNGCGLGRKAIPVCGRCFRKFAYVLRAQALGVKLGISSCDGLSGDRQAKGFRFPVRTSVKGLLPSSSKNTGLSLSAERGQQERTGTFKLHLFA